MGISELCHEGGMEEWSEEGMHQGVVDCGAEETSGQEEVLGRSSDLSSMLTFILCGHMLKDFIFHI